MLKIFAYILLIISGMIAMNMGTKLSNSQKISTEIHPLRRIIAGYRTDITWIPYYIYISLQDDNILRSCGGSIISSRWILTAAHCLYRNQRRISNNKILVYAGTSNSNILESTVQLRHIKHSVVHGNWANPSSNQITNHDIALLKTCTPFDFSREVQAIVLAPRNYVLRDGILALASGFGDTKTYGPSMKSDKLYSIVLRKRRCWSERPAHTIICFEGIHTKTEGICHGDSGGPLMYIENKLPILIGVASGTGCKANFGGGSFTDVSLYRDWIHEVTKI